MQVDLHYKDGLPYGLREVFHLRKNTLIENTASYFYVPGIFIFGGIGGCLAGLEPPGDGFFHGIGYGALVALSGMAASAILGHTVFDPRYITALKHRNAAFIEHYSE